MRTTDGEKQVGRFKVEVELANNDDMAVVHRITTAHLDVGTRPDADAASDSSAPDPFTKAFGEHHG